MVRLMGESYYKTLIGNHTQSIEWAYSLMHVGIVSHMPCMCVVKVVFTVYSRIICPKRVVNL